MPSCLFALSDAIFAIADWISQVFALLFYIFVVGLGLYGIASVIYNLTLAHERRKEKRLEPPTPRIRRIDYPDRDE